MLKYDKITKHQQRTCKVILRNEYSMLSHDVASGSDITP